MFTNIRNTYNIEIPTVEFLLLGDKYDLSSLIKEKIFTYFVKFIKKYKTF